MQIIIMRHGEAANIAGQDSLRPLTSYGLLETERMGVWLGHAKLKLDYIFVSPYLRAQQTCASVIKTFAEAELLEQADLTSLKPETLDFITPAGNASQVHDFIDGLFQGNNSIKNTDDDNQAILLISHMPFVSYLVAELTGSLNTPIFATGAVAIIDYDVKQMQGQLIKFVSPAELKS